MASEKGNAVDMARRYMDSLWLEGRIVGTVHPSTVTGLFGKTFDTPIMTAALSHLTRLHPGGVPELARGAGLAGACAQIGMGDVAEMESAIEKGCGVIKIIKPYADEKEIYQRLEAAEAAGALAVGMDLEHAVNPDDDQDSVVAGFPMQLKSPEQIRAYARHTGLPFLVKGALSASDALRCRDLGVRGLILSHHNSLFPWAVPPVAVLGDIRRAVGKDLVLIVDGGIADGADAYKALALGADAVSVGKALMDPLAKGGAEGVRDALLKMTAELKGCMLRTGTATLGEMDPSTVWCQAPLQPMGR